jgi:hypothetical protein
LHSHIVLILVVVFSSFGHPHSQLTHPSGAQVWRGSATTTTTIGIFGVRLWFGLSALVMVWILCLVR